MRIDFATTGRIIFGNGKVRLLPEILEKFGSRIMILRSKSASNIEGILRLLKESGFDIEERVISGEPNIEVINQTARIAREFESECIVSIGGGSVIDTGKAISALLNNPGELLDYLEVVGKGLPLLNSAAPFIAVPTTSGTGSEVTKNAVISVPEKSVKVSMRSNDMLPDVALVDPELTYSVSPEVTAFTGMDAFTQVIEPYVSSQANAFVDLICRDAIPRGAKYLKNAFNNGKDREARENMAWVSLMGGLALANAKLGAVHGFAGPIGGMYHQPHGTICASLMPAVMEMNILLLNQKKDGNLYLERYREIAVWVTGNVNADTLDLIGWLKELKNDLMIPSLSNLGISYKEFPEIANKANKSSSMKGNPVLLSHEQMIKTLEMAYE